MQTAVRCPRCGETKNRAKNFTRDRSRSTGYRAHCRACELEKQRKRRAIGRREEDPEEEKTAVALMVLRLVEQVGIEMRCEPTRYLVQDDGLSRSA